MKSKNPDYENLCIQADDAIKTLISEGGMFYSFRQLEDWLKQYSPVFKKIRKHYLSDKRVKPFRQLYMDVLQFTNSFPPRVAVRLALDKFPGREAPPSELSEWYEDFAELAENSEYLSHLLLEEEQIPLYIEVSSDPEIRVLCRPKLEALQFIKWHAEAAPKRVRQADS